MNAPPVFVAAAQDYATRLLEAIECPPGHPEDALPCPLRTASPAARFYTYRTLFPELRFAAGCWDLCNGLFRQFWLPTTCEKGCEHWFSAARAAIRAKRCIPWNGRRLAVAENCTSVIFCNPVLSDSRLGRYTDAIRIDELFRHSRSHYPRGRSDDAPVCAASQSPASRGSCVSGSSSRAKRTAADAAS